MIDWYQNTSQNNGANEEAWAAVQHQPEGVTETEWLSSLEELELHSSLIINGNNIVFAESPEAFSLNDWGASCSCELYPQSKYCRSDMDISNGKHYFLAIPKSGLKSTNGKWLVS